MKFKLACWLMSILPAWYLKGVAVYIHRFTSPTPWYRVFWSELREFWSTEVSEDGVVGCILAIFIISIIGLPIALDYILTMFLANAYIDTFPELYI